MFNLLTDEDILELAVRGNPVPSDAKWEYVELKGYIPSEIKHLTLGLKKILLVVRFGSNSVGVRYDWLAEGGRSAYMQFGNGEVYLNTDAVGYIVIKSGDYHLQADGERKNLLFFKDPLSFDDYGFPPEYDELLDASMKGSFDAFIELAENIGADVASIMREGLTDLTKKHHHHISLYKKNQIKDAIPLMLRRLALRGR